MPCETEGGGGGLIHSCCLFRYYISLQFLGHRLLLFFPPSHTRVFLGNPVDHFAHCSPSSRCIPLSSLSPDWRGFTPDLSPFPPRCQPPPYMSKWIPSYLLVTAIHSIGQLYRTGWCCSSGGGSKVQHFSQKIIHWRGGHQGSRSECSSWRDRDEQRPQVTEGEGVYS